MNYVSASSLISSKWPKCMKILCCQMLTYLLTLCHAVRLASLLACIKIQLVFGLNNTKAYRFLANQIILACRSCHSLRRKQIYKTVTFKYLCFCLKLIKRMRPFQRKNCKSWIIFLGQSTLWSPKVLLCNTLVS